MKKYYGSLLGLVAAVLVVSPLAQADQANDLVADEETVTVMTVDRSGKPPFKRRFVTMSLADAAMAESSDDARFEGGETVLLTTVDTRGKPPFKRRKMEVLVSDAAMAVPAAGEVDVKSHPPRRNRPPFLRHAD
ncbi:MAG: hypothetical protein V2I45_12670 [Halieaceae bacterium]|jgi:hypothetical protein|nr:hypothetical protein [Halieaceae bacterium]